MLTGSLLSFLNQFGEDIIKITDNKLFICMAVHEGYLIVICLSLSDSLRVHHPVMYSCWKCSTSLKQVRDSTVMSLLLDLYFRDAGTVLNKSKCFNVIGPAFMRTTVLATEEERRGEEEVVFIGRKSGRSTINIILSKE